MESLDSKQDFIEKGKTTMELAREKKNEESKKMA